MDAEIRQLFDEPVSIGHAYRLHLTELPQERYRLRRGRHMAVADQIAVDFALTPDPSFAFCNVSLGLREMPFNGCAVHPEA